MKRVLLVDSDQAERERVRSRLDADGYDVVECDTAAQVIDCFREGADAVVLCEPPEDTSPLRLLRELKAANPIPPVIMVSSSPSETLEALKEGAYYVTRPPLTPEEVSILVQRALSEDHGISRRSSIPPSPEPPPVLIGESAEIKAIRDAIQRLKARPTTSVLITGESGSGKDTVARLLHAETNQGGPLVQLSAASATSPEALEAELFGYETSGGQVRRGLAEQADGGTLLLGEIVDVPASLQSKLLRFVQERTFRRVGGTTDLVSEARVIATSSQNLDAAVREGSLKRELAYRLAVVTIGIPPLRQRRGDIPLLATHFLNRIAATSGSKPRTLSEAATKRLVEYSWPGNVRELANLLEGAVLLTDSEVLDVAHFPQLTGSRPGLDYRLPSQGIDFRELEREVLAQALRLASGNQTRAASLLGLTRDQIRYRMAKFGMNSRDMARAGVRAA
ncbi:MAG: sigma-54 dependent transcriptional regulator [Pseudomonadota bacterium]|nr:MAG: hypothetical protein DIU78_10060 [Pseudomonadota bacterium]